jgi:hypothetical protein
MKTTNKTEYRMKFNLVDPISVAGMEFIRENYGPRALTLVVQMAIRSFFDPSKINTFLDDMGVPVPDDIEPTPRAARAQTPVREAVPAPAPTKMAMPEPVAIATPMATPMAAPRLIAADGEPAEKIGMSFDIDNFMQ